MAAHPVDQTTPALPHDVDDVERAKDLLLWARAEGFWFEAVKVGAIEIVGARDYFPHIKARESAAAADDRADQRGAGAEGAYAAFGAGLPGGPLDRSEG